MGMSSGNFYSHDAKREFRRRRLQVLAYAGLVVLAVITLVVVTLALQR